MVAFSRTRTLAQFYCRPNLKVVGSLDVPRAGLEVGSLPSH